ncbi:MAG: hypothetical protein J6O73_09915 [Lachnospiraceae bacterium]|nr:hypothetical protein [Lachnospiraceae bacterium]
MKSKWETARYLIDAKKCVDSLWYIAENVSELKYIDLRKKSNEILMDFYIKCCVVVDEYIYESGRKKKDLCNFDKVIDRVYYERDKNGAHKDEKYIGREYSSLKNVCEDMKVELSHIRTVCADSIPDCLTLDYIPYDRELFRLIHHVTADAEDEIMRKKYPFRNVKTPCTDKNQAKCFNDTEDLRKISEEDKNQYGVLINNGICFYEGLQERQDAMIKCNVLWETDMWCHINTDIMEKAKELTRLGFFDDFGIVQGLPDDQEKKKEILKILKKIGIPE